MNRTRLIVGCVIVIVGVAAFFVGQSMHDNGWRTAMVESASRGEAIMRTANFVKFGGVGVGVLGAVAVLMGVVKPSTAAHG